MSTLTKLNNKFLKVYFGLITLIVLAESFICQSPNFIIIYSCFGPILFFILHLKLTFKFSSYVEQKYPELMEKHSIKTGIMAGEFLNILSVYLEKKDFEMYADTELLGYFVKGKLLVILTVLSFFITILLIFVKVFICKINLF